MKGKRKSSIWKAPKRLFFVFFLVMGILFARYCYLALSTTIDGHNIKEFAANRNTVSKILQAKRGTIYDSAGNILANNVTSYTIIAYLDESRSTNTKINHVKDIDKTASSLALVLDGDKDKIKEILETGKEKEKYQVELGTIGKNLTELKKGEVEELNLPGIDFEESYKRYYPNGDFASYILGYAKTNEKETEDGEIQTTIDGELGIEAKFDKTLKGTDGYLSYQRDRFGYKIPDTKETRIDAIDGSDIYLTLDASIQRFTETAVKEIEEKYVPDFSIISVMSAKTGDILASSATPSFDPNKRNITNYENPLVSNAFEPGSTMKIYTYMCAIEKGTYKGDKTFKSGSIEVEDATIKDWNNVGFGTITYDKGFEYSSNVGISYMLQSFIGREDLKKCFETYGFGKSTGVDMARELSGKLGFKYPVEVANAGFGQGIQTTPIQHLKALSIIANNGKALTPHIVKKIVDTNTNKVTYKRKVESSDTLVKEETINKIKNLMYNVVNSDDPQATGKKYQIEGFDIIGKTGTAQIYDSSNGGYLKGSNAYVYSFAGMYPKDDPEIIIYAAVKRPNVGATKVLSEPIVELMKNIAKYKQMFTEKENENDMELIKLDSYINKKTENVKLELKNHNVNAVVIGNGDKIISQYPAKGETILSYDKVFLITNDNSKMMPDLNNLSRSEVVYLMETLGYDYEIEGYGYVVSQSILPGKEVNGKVVIKLESKNK